MKKLIVVFLIVLIVIISSCGLSNNNLTVNEGDYALKVMDGMDDEIPILPHINLADEKFTFSYDMLSSYLPVGNYEINEDRLILITDDNKYKYVFKIADRSLFFIESESSDVKLIDTRLGIQIENNSEFVLSHSIQ
jgi:hypothetical protein